MVAVVLWIVWVAPYVLRNRGQQVLAAGESMVDAIDEETQEPQAGTVLRLAAQQEKPMETLQSRTAAADTGTRQVRGQNAGSRTGTLRIRYGRCAIALAGVGMLLTAFVSGVLRAFGVGSTWLPVGAVLATASAVFLLRFLAVRDRRARVKAAFDSAMAAAAPSAARPAEELPIGERRESRIFDAEAGRTEPAPLSAFELRQAALAVAAAAGDTSAPVRSKAPDRPQTEDPAQSEGWEPVEVPKPTYVDAAKAQRPAPEPLDLPEAPKPLGKPSLKQGATQAPAAPVEPAAAGGGQPGKGQSALSNLDDVLQRRRA